MSERPILSSRLVFGLLLLALGLAWMLDNLGFADVSGLMRWWPVLPLGWGLACLTGIGCPRRPLLGGFWTVVGGLSLLHSLDFISFSIFDLWPVLLIFAGASIVSRAWRGTPPPSSEGGDPDPRVNMFTMMGATKRKVTSQEFRGGDLSAILGGAHLDLRAARFAENRATLEVFAMWGGIELVVAPGTRVVGEVTPILGGFEDSTAAPVNPDAPTLVVRGVVLMGGVEVKNEPGLRGVVVDPLGETGRQRVGFSGPGVFVGGMRVERQRGDVKKTVEVGPLGVRIRAVRAGSDTPIKEVHVDLSGVRIERGPGAAAPDVDPATERPKPVEPE